MLACEKCGGTGIQPDTAEVLDTDASDTVIERFERQQRDRPKVYAALETILAQRLGSRLRTVSKPIQPVSHVCALVTGARQELLSCYAIGDHHHSGPRLKAMLDNLTDAAAEIVFLLASHGYPNRQDAVDRMRTEKRLGLMRPEVEPLPRPKIYDDED